MCDLTPYRARLRRLLARLLEVCDGTNESLAAHLRERGCDVSTAALARWRLTDREPPLALLIAALDHASPRARRAMLRVLVGEWGYELSDPSAAPSEDLVGGGLRLVEAAARWAGSARAALHDGRIDALEREGLAEELAQLRQLLEGLEAALKTANHQRAV